MVAGGYVVGYPGGSFGGNKAITRAEFVTIASRFMGEQSQTVSFTRRSAVKLLPPVSASDQMQESGQREG